MSVVWIPALLRPLTAGQDRVAATGHTLAHIIDDLEARYPGLRDRLCETMNLRAGLAAVIDGNVARHGLDEPVGEASEVHFVHAIGGGACALIQDVFTRSAGAAISGILMETNDCAKATRDTV